MELLVIGSHLRFFFGHPLKIANMVCLFDQILSIACNQVYKPKLTSTKNREKFQSSSMNIVDINCKP